MTYLCLYFIQIKIGIIETLKKLIDPREERFGFTNVQFMIIFRDGKHMFKLQ